MEKTKEEKKELRCPFDKTLMCTDCRLYISFLGGGEIKTCAFLRIA